VKFTDAPVAALRLVAGDHAYVVAPDAVIEVVEPEQIEAATGVIVTVGVGLTVMVCVAVPVQVPVVPVTV
jgi:hypothetical protein